MAKHVIDVGLKQSVEREVREDILNFWIKHTIDEEHGGFYGKITHSMDTETSAPKGLVLNTRILWSFSRAYNFFNTAEYLTIATRAYNYVVQYFWDKDFGGLYWVVDANGAVIDTKKQVYGQVFSIYAFSEYYRATQQEDALDFARRIYDKLEQYAYDPVNNGYIEALSRDWKETDQVRLSALDMNEKKSMNTHLHLLEAYANLYKVWNDKTLGNRLKNVIDVMLENIFDQDTLHFGLFFNEYWHKKSDTISFGHEIEGAWLIYDAVTLLDEKDYREKVKTIIVALSENVHKNALDGKNGKNGICNEQDGAGNIDNVKIWWVQAEACV
jgi:mannobiose 2-epimerase